MIKQRMILKEQILTKQKKNGNRLRKMLSACENLYDYKVLLYLIAEGSYENDSEFDLELFLHRLGKHVNVELKEEKKDA